LKLHHPFFLFVMMLRDAILELLMSGAYYKMVH